MGSTNLSRGFEYTPQFNKIMGEASVVKLSNQLRAIPNFNNDAHRLCAAMLEFGHNNGYTSRVSGYNSDSARLVAAIRLAWGKRYPPLRRHAISLMPMEERPMFEITARQGRAQEMTRSSFKNTCKKMDLNPAKIKKGTVMSDGVELITKRLMRPNELRRYLRDQIPKLSKADADALINEHLVNPKILSTVPKQDTDASIATKELKEKLRLQRHGIVTDSWADASEEIPKVSAKGAVFTSGKDIDHSSIIASVWLLYRHAWPAFANAKTITDFVLIFADGLAIAKLFNINVNLNDMNEMCGLAVNHYLGLIGDKISPKPSGVILFTLGEEDVFSRIRDSEFMHYFQKLVLGVSAALVSSSLFIGMPFTATILKFTNAFKSLLDFSTIGEATVHLFEIITTQIIPCITSMSLEPLQPIKYRARLTALAKFTTCAEFCFPQELMIDVMKEWGCTLPEDPLLVDEFTLKIQLLDTSYDMLSFLKTCHTESATGSISNAIQSLVSAQRALQSSITNTHRFQPFCVALSGPAGCGKTSYASGRMVAVLTEPLHMPVNRRPDSEFVYPPSSYVIVPAQDFQENASSSNKVVGFDDMSQVVKRVGDSEEFGLFWNIQSSVPVQIPKAALNSKRDMYWNNVLTWVTANTPNFGVTGRVLDTAAFYRRINVRVQFVATQQNRVYDIHATVLNMVTLKFDQYQFHEGPQEDRLRQLDDLIVRTAHDYIEHKREFLLSQDRGTRLCVRCRCPITRCDCDRPAALMILDVQPDVLIQGVPACFASPWIQTLASDHEKMFLLVICTIMEELAIASIVSRYSIPLMLALVIRVALDLLFDGGRLGSIKWFLAQICLLYVSKYLPFELSILLHVAYNLLVYSGVYASVKLKLLRLGFDKWNSSVFGGLLHIRTDGVPVFELGPRVPIIVDDLIAEFRASALNSFKQSIPSLTPILGLGAALLAAKFIYVRLINNAVITYTGFGTEATVEDITKTAAVQAMVASGYQGQTDGKANSWPQQTHMMFKKSCGTMPNAVEGNNILLVVKYRDKIRRMHAYYCKGMVYTVKHAVTDLPPENETEICFSGESCEQTVAINISEPAVFQMAIHDIVRFPIRSNRKSVEYVQCLKVRMGQIFLVNGKRVPLVAMVVPDLDNYNSATGVTSPSEPEGSFVIDYISDLGLSGKPVFLVFDGGVEIQPVFVGVASRMMPHTNLMIVAPISFVQTFTTLPDIIDVDVVRDHFSRYGFPLTNVTDKRSVLSHLLPNDFDKIGIYCGSIERAPYSNETAFKRSPLYDKAVEFCPDVRDYGVPNLKPSKRGSDWMDPMLACVRQLASRGRVVNTTPFSSAAEILFEHIIPVIREDLPSVAPLSIKQVIRGTSHTNPVNLKSGFGFPHFGVTKNEIIVGTLEDPAFVGWFADELREALELMDTGVPPLNVSKANVKDEILSSAKIDNGMERVFFAGSTVYLMLCRMHLSPLMDIFMKHRDKLFGQIGMNACGTEFHDRLYAMYERLSSDPTLADFLKQQGWLDTDFEKYDKRLLVIAWAIWVLWKIFCCCPYYMTHPVERNRLKLILQSFQQFVVILGNDVFLISPLSPFMPSGVNGTAWVNCVAEAIIEIIQFYYCRHIYFERSAPLFGTFVFEGYKEQNFFSSVSLINFGDDNGKYVDEWSRRYYTHSSIMMFSKFIQMGITPARKYETVIEFKTIKQLLFLKRTPVYFPLYKRLLGRLEFNSIGKMLAYTDSSEQSWTKMVLDQAVRELATYPPEVFERFCSIFGVIADQEQTVALLMSGEKWCDINDDLVPIVRERLEISEVVPGLTKSDGSNKI